MIGRVALLVTFKKAKPKSQSLSRSHIRDLAGQNGNACFCTTGGFGTGRLLICKF